MSGNFHIGDNIHQTGDRNVAKMVGSPWLPEALASTSGIVPPADPKLVPREPLIFINYRMTDDKAATYIDAELTRRLGYGTVFRDAKMAAGTEFSAELIHKARTCKVMVAIIGEKWDDTYGLRLLEDPSDWVRIELATALTHDVYIAPILVGARKRPDPTDLPADIRRVANLQARHLRTGYDEHDVRRLVDDLLGDLLATLTAFRGR